MFIILVVAKLRKHSDNIFVQIHLKAIRQAQKTKPQINQDAVRLMKEIYQIDMGKNTIFEVVIRIAPSRYGDHNGLQCKLSNDAL